MKNLLKLACSALLLVGCGACVTGPEGERELDLQALHAHVDAAELTINDLVLATQATEPELSADLAKVAAGIKAVDDQIEAAIASGTTTAGLIPAIDLLIEISAPLVEAATDDPRLQARVRLAVIAARAILVQVKLALPPPAEPEPPAPAPAG